MWKGYQLDLYQFYHQHHLMALDGVSRPGNFPTGLSQNRA